MIVDKKTFADIIGVSPRMISNYIDEGMPTQGGGGRGVAVQIETIAALKWLQQRAIDKEIGANEDDEGKGSKSYEDRRLAKAKADRMEFALARDKGLHPHIDEVKDVLFTVATEFGKSLDGLGSRVAQDFALETEPAAILKRMGEESREVRRKTAERLRKWVANYQPVDEEQGVDDDRD